MSLRTRLTLAGTGSRPERAVDNVLDSPIKRSPSGGPVEARLVGRRLTARDHGPASPRPTCRIDRLYLAAAARAQPGSGLGLAIVKQTVDDHRGGLGIANADGGGTLVTLRFDADG